MEVSIEDVGMKVDAAERNKEVASSARSEWFKPQVFILRRLSIVVPMARNSFG